MQQFTISTLRFLLFQVAAIGVGEGILKIPFTPLWVLMVAGLAWWLTERFLQFERRVGDADDRANRLAAASCALLIGASVMFGAYEAARQVYYRGEEPPGNRFLELIERPGNEAGLRFGVKHFPLETFLAFVRFKGSSEIVERAEAWLEIVDDGCVHRSRMMPRVFTMDDGSGFVVGVRSDRHSIAPARSLYIEIVSKPHAAESSAWKVLNYSLGRSAEAIGSQKIELIRRDLSSQQQHPDIPLCEREATKQ